MYQAQRYFRTLELEKVLAKLAEQANCDDSKQMALGLTPSDDYNTVRALMQKTSDAYMLSARYTSPALHKLKNCEAALRKSQKGSNLSLRELMDVSAVLHNIRSVKDWRKRCEGESTSLDGLFEVLVPNKELENTIDNAVLSEEELADSASPELADLRRKINQAKLRVRERLDHLIKSPTQSKFLQDALVTMRDGRFVVPVKSEYRSEIKGLVHDTSASGATIFIEPMAVVEANNEIRVLQAKEKREIERIIQELSEKVGDFAESIIYSYRALVEIDLYFAKASLAYKMKATVPNILETGEIDLKKARHPLIDPQKVVPIDVNLGKDFNTLVITGPNTGGKTVSLKTLGLLTLMAQCGFHIPADYGSAVSVFDRVLADIGDEQSIEQSLSTFSAHMVNIVKILEEADGKSLILFDELGAGTDPVEGAALAIAIIQHVREKGAKVAATTHYAELKTFAMTTKGVENASCEFDVETLRPTYKLLIGIPGKSNAFAISQRLGLDPAVIETAKAQMDSESIRFEDVLTQLEAKRQSLEKDKDEAERLRLQRESDAKRAREFREQMERAKDNARTRGEAEARRIIREARAQADQIFEELNQLRRQQEKAADWQSVNDARAAIRGQLNRAEEELHFKEEKEPIPAPSRPIREGDLVELGGTRKQATVTAVNGDKLQLLAGNMKLTVKASEVRLVEEAELQEKKKIQRQVQTSIRLAGARAACNEIDLRGMMTDEAELAVERFLDNAVMGKLNEVTIIHGKGTGALRKAVQQLLRRHPKVKSFRLGRYGEGEDGVTVVELKQ